MPYVVVAAADPVEVSCLTILVLAVTEPVVDCTSIDPFTYNGPLAYVGLAVRYISFNNVPEPIVVTVKVVPLISPPIPVALSAQY